MEEAVRPSRQPRRRVPFAFFVALAAVAAAIWFLLMFKLAPGRAGRATRAPNFVLTDQLGRRTSLAQFRGKVVLLTFIDPECHQLCPLATQSMVNAVRRLSPQAAAQVVLLGVDANPLKTQVADVADYTRTHGLQNQWRFLTGSKSELERVWRAYHIYVAIKNNDIEHTAVVYEIDQRGNERQVYNTPMSYAHVGGQSEELAQGVAQLLPGRPPAAAPGNGAIRAAAAIGHQGPLRYVSLGSKPEAVTMGGGHAHLVVFFAGWLAHDGISLPAKLGGLDDYAAAARRHGWPSAVAVDEYTTEPSAAEAEQVLKPVLASLKTPVISDKTGVLADSYGVNDLPWYVLTSADGTLIWNHDGWLPAAELETEVGTALVARPAHPGTNLGRRPSSGASRGLD